MDNESLCQATGAIRVTDDCLDFYGGWFSSFALIPFTVDGVRYATREHYFQAQKALDFTDFQSIVTAATPGRAKVQGSLARLRPDWEAVKLEVMVVGIRHQVQQDTGFRTMLRSTGARELREDSPSDGIWGFREVKHGRSAGPGLNLLGKALMVVRHEIQ